MIKTVNMRLILALFAIIAALYIVKLQSKATSITDASITSCGGLEDGHGSSWTITRYSDGTISEKCEDGLLWIYNEKTNGDTLVIQGNGHMKDNCCGWRYAIPSQKIKKIIIKDGVKSIGNNYAHDEGIFAGCKNLETVTMADSVTSLGISAFFLCPKLKKINFSNNLKTIKRDAFSSCGIKTIRLPDSLTSLAKQTFLGSAALETVYIPKNVETIHYDTFFGCTKLKKVIFSEDSKLKTIGTEAFFDCRNLKNINLPSGLKTIKTDAFFDCRSLKAIDLPSSLLSIGKDAFYGCSKLHTVVIPKKVNSLGACIFESSGVRKIVIKSKKLNEKNTSKGLAKYMRKSAVFYVPKSKYKSYKKLLMRRGIKADKIKKGD